MRLCRRSSSRRIRILRFAPDALVELTLAFPPVEHALLSFVGEQFSLFFALYAIIFPNFSKCRSLSTKRKFECFKACPDSPGQIVLSFFLSTTSHSDCKKCRLDRCFAAGMVPTGLKLFFS